MDRLTLIIAVLLLTIQTLPAQEQPAKADQGVGMVIKKTAQAITPATYTGRQIAVGSGGGFTGFSTTYYLLDNGQLFGQRSLDSSYTFIATQTTPNTKRIFTVLEKSCKIKSTQFANPGNRYKFVQWQKGKQKYRVAWGGTGKAISANYPKFYDSFMAMIPTALRLK